MAVVHLEDCLWCSCNMLQLLHQQKCDFIIWVNQKVRVMLACSVLQHSRQSAKHILYDNYNAFMQRI